MPEGRTDIIQAYIDDQLVKLLTDACDEAAYLTTAEEIQAFLADSSKHSTPDFVLRRHIAKNQPLIAGAVCQLPEDLPWDDSVCAYVAKALQKQHPEISKKVWQAYLEGTSAPNTREKALHVAVLTKMDFETVQKLLLSLEFNTLNMRYPLDILCYASFQSPGLLSWAQIQNNLSEFRKEHEKEHMSIKKLIEEETMCVGATEYLKKDLDKILNKAENVPEKIAELMELMKDCADADILLSTDKALSAYTKTKERGFLHLSKLLVLQYPVYFMKVNRRSDLEMSACHVVETDEKGIPQMAQLGKAMFYKVFRDKLNWMGVIPADTEEIDYQERKAVLDKIKNLRKKSGKDKTPKLTQSEAQCLRDGIHANQGGDSQAQQKALLMVEELLERNIIKADWAERINQVIQKGKLHNKKFISGDQLESYFFKYFDGFNEHMQKVDHAIRGSEGEHAFFTRNDALLFCYFFILGIDNPFDKDKILPDKTEMESKYDDRSKSEQNAATNRLERRFEDSYKKGKSLGNMQEKFEAMLESIQQEDKWFGDAISEAIDRWKDLREHPDRTPQDKYQETLNVVNLILASLGQRKIYVLSRIDCAILLALLAGEPENMLPLSINKRYKEYM